jgi:hypothetical protein
MSGKLSVPTCGLSKNNPNKNNKSVVFTSLCGIMSISTKAYFHRGSTMSQAFEITTDDIQTVFEKNFGEHITDDAAEEIFDNYIHLDDVEHAALRGGDIDEQTQFAHDEIKEQLQVNIADINLTLNEIT